MNIKIYTSSEVYEQIRPDNSKLADLESKLEGPNRYTRYQIRHVDGPFEVINGEEIKRVIYALALVDFTNEQIYGFLKKSIDLVKDSEAYVGYLFEKNFGDSKKYALPPGTIRIYSKSLICFFDGKNWRKFRTELPTI